MNTQAKLLIALDIGKRPITALPFTNTVIHCKPNEIKDVRKAFETFFTGETFISIEPDEALVIFANQKNVHFAHAVKQANQTLEQFAQQVIFTIPKISLTKLCILIQGAELNFEEFHEVKHIFTKNFEAKRMEVFYALDVEGVDTSISLFAIGI